MSWTNLFNRKTKATPSTQTTPSLDELIDLGRRGEPLQVETIPQEVLVQIANDLYTYGLELDAVKLLPEHPRLGIKPIEAAVMSVARTVTYMAEKSMMLYVSAGGHAGLAVTGERQLGLAYFGYPEQDDLSEAKPKQIISLTGTLVSLIGEGEPRDDFVELVKVYAKAIEDGDDIEELHHMFSSKRLAHTIGAMIVAGPFLALPSGNEARIPLVMPEVVGLFL